MHVVPPDKLAEVWPEVSPWLERALAYGQGDEALIDILIALARGHYLLWHEPKTFAFVVQIVNQPRQRVLTVLYGGGNLEALRASFGHGMEWAKAHGVDVIRIWGREGWERTLGMERIGVILQRKL